MTSYNKLNPFLATITERYKLCGEESGKNTIHLTLDLKGSGLVYQVGDSIAIQALNSEDVVIKTVKCLRATGEEIVKDKHAVSYSLNEFLSRKGNLTEVPRKLISELANRQSNLQKQEQLQLLLAEGQKDRLKEYQASHEIWDTLEENSEVVFSPQEFCLLIQPLLPRFYSISSAMSAVGEEVHLTVAEVVYETNGHLRRGACTHYLCQLAPMNVPTVPIYIQPANGFTLPTDGDIPVIMVGPGTGVAPFRAFMQDRQAFDSKGFNWLFFGERHEAHHFFYESYWQGLVESGRMRLSTAFSRDQEHKIYVQHRLLEHGEELFHWLQRGAYFYVCGDASRMAKDVDAALHQIVQVHGKYDEQATKEYVKGLRTTKRYLRDVY